MDRKQHSLLNLCLFGVMSVWASIHPAIAGMNSGGGWGLAWFAVLYLAAAWLRLYYIPSGRPGKWFAVYLLIPLGMATLQCLGGGDAIGTVVHTIAANWFRYDSAPVYIMSVCLFVAFLNVTIRGERFAKAVRSVAGLTFGVYLIHAHANVSPWSWEVSALPAKMETAAFVPIQFGVVAGFFVVCAAMEALRKATVGRLEKAKLLIRLTETCSQWFARKFGLLLKEKHDEDSCDQR